MSFLIESALKVALLVAAGLLATSALHGRSAAFRHWVLAVTLAAAMLVPLLMLVAPSWSLPVRASEDAKPSRVTTVSVTPADARTLGGEITDQAQAAADGAPGLDGVAIFLTVWFTGVVLSLGGVAVGLWRLGRIASVAVAIEEGPWHVAMRALAGRYRLPCSVRLLRSEDVGLPVAFGFVEPRVLLPANAESYTSERIHVVLAHELAHIGRGDWILQMAGELLRAIYWFNPLVWAACDRLRLESERACDDAVVALGVPGGDYAVHLLELARAFGGSRQRRIPAVSMVSRPSSLERRISAMLNPDLNRRPLSALVRLGIVGALFLVMLSIALFAQNTFATLSGSITDESGAFLPGVAVVAADTERGVRHEVRTDGAGRFELIGLPQGAYGLEAGLPGFETFHSSLTLEGEDVARNITMKIGSLQETIVVTSEPSEPKTVAVRAAPSTAGGCGPRSSWPPSVLPDGARRVGGQIKVPVKIRNVPPVYPVGSGPGIVRMDTLIGTDGFVQQVDVTSATSPELAQAAEQAVRQWQFTQTLLNCVPVDVRMSVLVEFR